MCCYTVALLRSFIQRYVDLFLRLSFQIESDGLQFAIKISHNNNWFIAQLFSEYLKKEGEYN